MTGLGVLARESKESWHAAGVGLHDHDPVSKMNRLVDVMGHQQRCRPLMLNDAFEFLLQPEARQRVQGTERLVKQQELRPVDERSSNGNTLGHSS